MLLAGFIQPSERKATLRQIACVCAGGLAVFAGYLFYQGMATGDPLLIETSQGGENSFGFGGSHTPAVGLTNEQTQLSLLLLVFQNWTPALGLVLVLLPFAFGSRNRWDWFLLVAAGVFTA